MTNGVRFSEAERELLRGPGRYATGHDLSDLFPGRTLAVLLNKRRQMALAESWGSYGLQRREISDYTETERARLGRIADLLQRSGINPDDIGKVEQIRVNEWQGFYKDENSEAQVVDMTAASVVLSPAWESGPAWPVVQPAAAPILGRSAQTGVKTPRGRPAASTAATGLRSALILPDMQIGFYKDASGEYHTTHDEAALDVAVQILTVVRPDRVILLGDNLDFPELSRFRKEPAFAQTTQRTVDRATLLLATIRAGVRKSATIDWLEGNHDIRVSTYIKDNAAAAFGLKQGNAPQSWPVLSVPNLCRFDEVGVTYVPGYPASGLWLNDRLRCIHGFRAQKRSNAYPYLDEERASTIYAHTHRREWAERTRHTRYGPRTIMAASPGALCRIDGVVPSSHSGTDLDGVPIQSFEDWQQGLAVVYYAEGEGPFFFEQVPIHQGLALWHGQRFQATCDVEGRPV